MALRTMARAPLVLLGALALACTSDAPKSPLAPSLSVTSDPVVSGAVLGPDGNNICASLPDPDGSVYRIRPIDPAAGAFAAPVQVLTCPANSFSFNVGTGRYLLRAILPFEPAIGMLPARPIEAVSTDGGDVVQDVFIQNGTALGGSATLDGAPLADVDMTVVFDEAPGFLAAAGASDANGAWTEFFRPPLILQNDVRYQAGCGALGVRQLEGPPSSFLVPEVSAINCTFETGLSTRFSHSHTRVVVTPMAGEIGGQTLDPTDRYGIGWGVQFPVELGQSPVHVPTSATHLFGGGLMIGIAPDRILTGVNIEGQLECGAACQDLGLDAVVHFTPETPIGRRVMWRYSDATSPEGVGLRVTQQSYDGQLPNDYVLFRFSIQNGGTETVTFYAGAFMDWDVEDDAADDLGFTDMDGRLMAVASAGELGMHVGTLLVGAPVSGNVFYNFSGQNPIPASTTDQFQALSGGMQNPSIGPGDAHNIHGVGPITLKRGHQLPIWLAIVVGENRDQLLANARAAQADIARRQNEADDVADGPLTVTTPSSGTGARPFAKARALQ